MERVQDVQADCLADDIEIEAAMVDWSDGELREFFETGGATRPVAANENSGSSATVRLYAISDLHWDYQKNRTWLDALPAGAHRSDAIILAGDITHVCADLESCLRRFKAIFGEVLHAHMHMQTTRTQHAYHAHAHAHAPGALHAGQPRAMGQKARCRQAFRRLGRSSTGPYSYAHPNLTLVLTLTLTLTLILTRWRSCGGS